MKKIILFFILGIVLVPTLVRSEVQVNFSIEKNLNDNLDSTQKENISTRVSELSAFFKNDVIPHIPVAIFNKIQNLTVIIHLSDKSGRDGLFIPDVENHQHKIIVQLNQINSNGFKALLAHEFFHAVHFEINPNEAPWVREGLAQLFEYIVTDELNGLNLMAAINNPSTPLIGNYDIENVNAAQYGHNMLYFYYLYKHCGGDQFFWNTAGGVDNLKGAYLIDSILDTQNSQKAECKNFLNSAISFEVAKVHNQVQFLNNVDGERFFLAPTNLSPKKIVLNSQEELATAINKMPIYSSLRFDLDSWTRRSGVCQSCSVFYTKRTFPYDVSELMPAEQLKSYDVVLVKTGQGEVLTGVSSKNTGK